MRWGKILLLFQAVVTLIIGIAFFSQLTSTGISDISELRTSFMSGKNTTGNSLETITNIKNKFTIASYLLLMIGLIEIIIIMRLIS